MEMDENTDGWPNLAHLHITPEILSLIAEIDEFKGAWRATWRIAPEKLSSLRRVATIESIGSSTRIEGARLSDRNVEKLLANLRIGAFASRDEEEVAGYADVMETVFAHWEALAPTQNHLLQLHRDLLAHSGKDERHRSAYKTVANNVEAFDENGKSLGVVFATASPFDTPRRMQGLMSWLQARENDKALHPLLMIGVFVVVFLEIHPFQDGNGRLSRILTTLLLLRAGYAFVPYGSLESVIEQNKEGYYLALRRTQGTIRSPQPDWTPWLKFFLRALQRQKRSLEAKIERERIVLARLPELSVRILELAREQGRVTVATATALTGASRNTIKDHLKALVAQGRLRRKGAGRATWYALE
jgi:Fic family protein